MIDARTMKKALLTQSSSLQKYFSIFYDKVCGQMQAQIRGIELANII